MSTSLPLGPRPSHTKIVATLGPASSGVERIRGLMIAGVDVFRLNMAHASIEEHQATLTDIRAVSDELGRPVGVLADLSGPKIRLGRLPDDQLTFDVDQLITFVRGDESQNPGELTTTYPPLIDELAVGDRVMLADGTVSLSVEKVDADRAECRVVQPGTVRSRQGVNLPGVKLSAPAIGPVDRENAIWAAGSGIDFVGLSFVRAADEVRQLKSLLQSSGSEAHVVAKIEKPEALEHLHEIVEAADAVMVARGDLGVEIDIARVAVAQKEIIAECGRCRKPVIIATQMLDSMQNSRLPTRAEVADVSNAILDGADACMLSGETAIGKHPQLAVAMMHRIALATEPLCRERPPLPLPDLSAEGVNQITEATVYSAGRMAEKLDAKLIVVATVSGATALSLSKNRNDVPTLAVSESPTTLQRMCLYWGMIPLAGVPVDNRAELLAHITDWGAKAGMLGSGDRIILITGTGLSVTAHNVIVVHELE